MDLGLVSGFLGCGVCVLWDFTYRVFRILHFMGLGCKKFRLFRVIWWVCVLCALCSWHQPQVFGLGFGWDLDFGFLGLSCPLDFGF